MSQASLFFYRTGPNQMFVLVCKEQSRAWKLTGIIRVRYRLNFIDSDSFRFPVSIPM